MNIHETKRRNRNDQLHKPLTINIIQGAPGASAAEERTPVL